MRKIEFRASSYIIHYITNLQKQLLILFHALAKEIYHLARQLLIEAPFNRKRLVLSSFSFFSSHLHAARLVTNILLYSRSENQLRSPVYIYNDRLYWHASLT